MRILSAVLLSAMLLSGCGLSRDTKDPPTANAESVEKKSSETQTPETEKPSDKEEKSSVPSAEPSPTPTPTPTPTPELVFPDGSSYPADTEKLSLTALKHADVEKTAELIRQMPMLKSIDLGEDGAWTPGTAELTAETAAVERPAEATRDLSWEDILAIREAAPKADVIYRFRFFGRNFTTLDREMDLNHSPMSDEGAAVRRVLPCMQRLQYLDMDSCGVSSESMAKIRDDYPDVAVVWRIWFANGTFTVRTDIEMLWCANFYAYMTDEFTQELKYCTRLKYLDLGHNLELHDWSFLEYMPDLEVLIMTASAWDDLHSISGCTKLEFLEAIPPAHTYVDLTPLAPLVNLKHLNICGIGESDGWEVLLNMKKLERLWIGTYTACSFPEGAIDQIRAALPNTEINVTEQAAAVGSWRINPDGTTPERYLLLRQQFDYDNWPSHAPYYYNDPKYNPPW